MNTWAIALLMSVAGYLLAPVPIRRRPICLRGASVRPPRSSRTPGRLRRKLQGERKQHFRRRRSQDAARAAAVELVVAFAAELRAGNPARQGIHPGSTLESRPIGVAGSVRC